MKLDESLFELVEEKQSLTELNHVHEKPLYDKICNYFEKHGETVDPSRKHDGFAINASIRRLGLEGAKKRAELYGNKLKQHFDIDSNIEVDMPHRTVGAEFTLEPTAFGENLSKTNESVDATDKDELMKLCDEIGIKTLGDLDRFMKDYQGKDVLQALRDYRKELGDDFKIEESAKLKRKSVVEFLKKKKRALKENKEDLIKQQEQAKEVVQKKLEELKSWLDDPEFENKKEMIQNLIIAFEELLPKAEKSLQALKNEALDDNSVENCVQPSNDNFEKDGDKNAMKEALKITQAKDTLDELVNRIIKFRKEYYGGNISFFPKSISPSIIKDQLTDKTKIWKFYHRLVNDLQDIQTGSHSTTSMERDAAGEHELLAIMDAVEKLANSLGVDINVYATDGIHEGLSESIEQSQLEDNGISALITKEINGENDTIQSYKDLIVALETNNKSDFVPVINDIIKEEEHHVGQLQTLLDQLKTDTIENIDKGQVEASQQLDTNDELSTEINKEN